MILQKRRGPVEGNKEAHPKLDEEGSGAESKYFNNIILIMGARLYPRGLSPINSTKN